jgi:hypothetical protein
MHVDEKIELLLNNLQKKVKFPAPIYIRTGETITHRHSLSFNLAKPLKPEFKDDVEVTNFDRRIIDACHVDLDRSEGFYLRTTGAIRDIKTIALEDLKQLWMAVNNKSNWRRTKLSKKTYYGEWDKILELWLDMVENNLLTCTNTPENTSGRKFFAKKFEQLGKVGY